MLDEETGEIVEYSQPIQVKMISVYIRSLEIDQDAIFTLLMDLLKVIFDESEIEILQETHVRL